jgi:hypothetical protein
MTFQSRPPLRSLLKVFLASSGIAAVAFAGVAAAAGVSWSPGDKPGTIALPPKDASIEVKDAKGAVAYSVPASRVIASEIPPSATETKVRVGDSYKSVAEVNDPEGIAQIEVTMIVQRAEDGGVTVTQQETIKPDQAVAACRASKWTLKGCVSAARLRANPNARDLAAPNVVVSS